MRIFTKTADLKVFLASERLHNHSIGFVPTMGALHQGHLSLVAAAKKSCHLCVCSIFVNPNQFNDKEDLKRYPRTPDADIRRLEEVFCDVLFMPTVEEVYPQEDHTQYHFGHLDRVLEGANRPGHFNGVAQVVRRLFEIVQPNKAFFGSKDYQQVMVVKRLVKDLKLNITILPCPILREPDGLAMSSRNTLLDSRHRKIAGSIPGMMRKAAEKLRAGETISSVRSFIRESSHLHEEMRLEYFEVCEASTLEILNDGDRSQNRIALIAIFVGKIRLIDNINIDETESPQLN